MAFCEWSAREIFRPCVIISPRKTQTPAQLSKMCSFFPYLSVEFSRPRQLTQAAAQTPSSGDKTLRTSNLQKKWARASCVGSIVLPSGLLLRLQEHATVTLKEAGTLTLALLTLCVSVGILRHLNKAVKTINHHLLNCSVRKQP